MKKNYPVILLAGLAFAGSASAASIMGTRTDIASGSTAYFDLSTLGSSDWAFWNTSASPASGVPTESKSGATLITNMTAVSGGNVRGSSSTSKPSADFSWTADGTGSASGTQDNATGLFNSQLDVTGGGVGVTVTIPTAETYQVTVWTYAFGGTGNFTASMPGVTSAFTDSSAVGDFPGYKPSSYFTLTVTPDNANDVLTITNTLTDDTSGNNSNVGIMAVSIRMVPEPASFALLSLGGLLAFRRKR